MEGYELTPVHNGEDGLQQALSGKFDLILLDVMLPKKNGFEVLRNLRAQSSIPVIMLRAFAQLLTQVTDMHIN